MVEDTIKNVNKIILQSDSFEGVMITYSNTVFYDETLRPEVIDDKGKFKYTVITGADSGMSIKIDKTNKTFIMYNKDGEVHSKLELLH